MEFIINFLQIFTAFLLLNYIYVNRKLTKENNEKSFIINQIITKVENATYNIEDLKKENRPNLDFDLTIKDISVYRVKATEYDNIKAEYKNLVEEYPKLEKELQKQIKLKEMSEHDIQKVCTKAGIEGTFLKEYWLAVFESTIIKKLERLELLEKTLKIIRDEFNTIFSEIGNPITKSITSYANMVVTRYKENEKEYNKAMEVIKVQKKEFKKKIHVKDQTIYLLRKKLNKKTGQNKKNI